MHILISAKIMCKNTFILLLIPIFILVSCSNDNQGFAIGSEIIPSNTDVVVLDTFSLQSYTVKVDSIATSGFTKALVGLYQPTNANEDVYLGTDTVSAYF